MISHYERVDAGNLTVRGAKNPIFYYDRGSAETKKQKKEGESCQ